MALPNIYKNVGASILPQFVNIISNLILPGLIISVYGSQVNGLVSTIKSIVGYISLVGAGIAVATTQALYLPIAQKNQEEVKGMLKSASSTFNQAGCYYVTILIFVSLFYPLLINSNVPYTTILGLILVIGISGASEFFIVGTCRSLLFADRKTHVASLIQASSLLVSLIVAILLLKMQTGIIAVQFGISLVYIIRAIFLRAYIRKNYSLYWYDTKTKPINKVVEKRGDAMIHQLSGLAVWSTQTIILSIMVGLDAASIYAVYNIVFSGLMSICTNINNAITPFIGRSLMVESIETTRYKFNYVEYGMHLLTIFLYSITAIMIVPFISIYTKGADIEYVFYDYALLFTLVHILNIKRLPNNALINAAGHFRETRMRAIIEATVCIIMSLLFTYLYGMYGVLLGTLSAFAWRCIDIIVYSNKHILKQNSGKSLFRLTRCVVIVFILYECCSKHVFTANIQNYFEWAYISLKCSFYAVIAIFIDAILFDIRTTKSFTKIIIKI